MVARTPTWSRDEKAECIGTIGQMAPDTLVKRQCGQVARKMACVQSQKIGGGGGGER